MTAPPVSGTTRRTLSPRLAAALRPVTVTGATTARFGRREITAGSTPELTQRLARMIYDVLHAGRDGGFRARWRFSHDEEFEACLAAAVPHAEVVREAVAVRSEPGEVVVDLAGVKVRLPPGAASGPASAGATVAARMASVRPALSPGFLAVSGTQRPGWDTPALRVYLHLRSPAAAVSVWGSVLRLLEDRNAGYLAKVVSSPELLPRRDALVVYLGPGDRATASDIAALVAGASGVGTLVSVFAEPLGPGVAIACEPVDQRPASAGLSFGEHRARAVAEGITRYATAVADGQAVPIPAESALAAVTESLLDAGIDPASPAHNMAPC